jgi:hypothetical protein
MMKTLTYSNVLKTIPFRQGKDESTRLFNHGEKEICFEVLAEVWAEQRGKVAEVVDVLAEGQAVGIQPLVQSVA